MRARLASTVLGLMNSAAAVSRLVIPEAASSATRCSAGSVLAVVGPTLTRASSVGPLGPQGGAQVFEGFQRLT